MSEENKIAPAYFKDLKRLASMKRPPSNMEELFKADSSIKYNYEREYRKYQKTGETVTNWKYVEQHHRSRVGKEWEKAKELAKAGSLKNIKTASAAINSINNAQELKDAKAYIKKFGHLKKGTEETKKALDNGDDSQKKLWRFHKQDLKAAQELVSKSQKTDAQSKTAKVPKALRGIADKMRDKGKGGWVTINGTPVFLG